MKKLPIILLLSCLVLPLMAQTEQEVLPAERKAMTIITEPYTLYKGFFRAGVAMQYSSLYKIFDENNKRVPLTNASGKTWSGLLILQYGISDRLQVNLDLPYLNQDLFLSYMGELPGANVFEQQKFEGRGSGLGDISIGAGYQLLTETVSRPAVKFTGTFIIPTGQSEPQDTGDLEIMDIPVGAGHYAVDLSLSMRKINYPFSYTAYLDYKLNLPGEKIMELGGSPVSYKDGDLLTVSGSYNFHMNEWLALTNDVYYFLSFEDETAGEISKDTGWVIEYAPRLSFQIKRLRVNQSVQIPIAGKLSGADPGFILIVQYVF
jgi:hypothetical protein